jgi:hypothetical protein
MGWQTRQQSRKDEMGKITVETHGESSFDFAAQFCKSANDYLPRQFRWAVPLPIESHEEDGDQRQMHACRIVSVRNLAIYQQ